MMHDARLVGRGFWALMTALEPANLSIEELSMVFTQAQLSPGSFPVADTPTTALHKTVLAADSAGGFEEFLARLEGLLTERGSVLPLRRLAAWRARGPNVESLGQALVQLRTCEESLSLLSDLDDLSALTFEARAVAGCLRELEESTDQGQLDEQLAQSSPVEVDRGRDAVVSASRRVRSSCSRLLTAAARAQRLRDERPARAGRLAQAMDEGDQVDAVIGDRKEDLEVALRQLRLTLNKTLPVLMSRTAARNST